MKKMCFEPFVMWMCGNYFNEHEWKKIWNQKHTLYAIHVCSCCTVMNEFWCGRKESKSQAFPLSSHCITSMMFLNSWIMLDEIW